MGFTGKIITIAFFNIFKWFFNGLYRPMSRYDLILSGLAWKAVKSVEPRIYFEFVLKKQHVFDYEMILFILDVFYIIFWISEDMVSAGLLNAGLLRP